MDEDADVLALCDVVRQTAFDLHCFLRHGHMESVYEQGMMNRLCKRGLVVERQLPLSVLDEDGTVLGEFRADLLIEGKLIVELKACGNLINEHIAQLLGYLRASRIRHGLLINFGNAKLQIKKYAL